MDLYDHIRENCNLKYFICSRHNITSFTCTRAIHQVSFREIDFPGYSRNDNSIEKTTTYTVSLVW